MRSLLSQFCCNTDYSLFAVYLLVSEFSADDVGDDEETVRDINYDQSAPAAHRVCITNV